MEKSCGSIWNRGYKVYPITPIHNNHKKCLPNKLFAGQLITVTNNAIDKNNNPRKCKVLCFFTSIKLGILYLLNRPIDMLIKTRVRNIYKYAFIKNLLQVNFPPLKEFFRIPSVRSPDNISSI